MRILILMSHTGGGHTASAQALQAGFERLYPQQVEVATVDLLIDHVARPLNQLPKTYGMIANHMPWLWQQLWSTGHDSYTPRKLLEGIAYLSELRLVHLLEDARPDLLISVHPLVHELSFHALDVLQWRLPFFTVVTDLVSTYPLWFYPRITTCFVASDAAYHHAIQCGLQPKQLRLYGLPVRPAFAATLPAKEQLRQSLQMHPDLPAVLLIGGGDGIGPVAAIAQQLDQQLRHQGQPTGQLIVICGRNADLQQQLTMQPWRIPTQIHGFVENMPAWMTAADCVITKAGPGTIAEATICGLPMLLSGFIPGQEEGNIPFVVDQGAGVFCQDPVEIGRIITRWFGPEWGQLRHMSERSRQLARPQATFQIAQAIMKIAEAAVDAGTTSFSWQPSRSTLHATQMGDHRW